MPFQPFPLEFPISSIGAKPGDWMVAAEHDPEAPVHLVRRITQSELADIMNRFSGFVRLRGVLSPVLGPDPTSPEPPNLHRLK